MNAMNSSEGKLRKGLSAAALLVLLGPAQAFELPTVGVPNIFGGETKDGTPPPPGATPDCPEIYLDPGAAMIRTPPEADSASVRYQLSIRQTARECVISGDSLSIKVGVEGNAMLGPQGAPGSYGGNVRIAVRDARKDTIVATKNYRVGANIGAGANRADFQLIAEPFVVPLVSQKSQDDYEILVGFTQGGSEDSGKAPAARGAKKKKRRR